MYACFDPKGEELICLATLQVSHAPSPPLLYIKHLSSALSLSLHTSSNTVIPIQFYQPQLITTPADPGHNNWRRGLSIPACRIPTTAPILLRPTTARLNR